MPEWMGLLQTVLKILFWGVVPLLVIYYRYKKKISTGFAVGIILSSLLMGLMSAATVKQDPVQVFMTAINSGKHEDSKKAYKILVQFGPEYLSKIDESQIVDLALFEKLKKELQDDYFDIASRYYSQYSVTAGSECREVITQQEYLHNLQHALVLLGYSRSIGKAQEDLEEKLRIKIRDGERIMAEMEERCD